MIHRLLMLLMLLGVLSACGTPAGSADATAPPSQTAEPTTMPAPSAAPDEREITAIIDYYDDGSTGVISAPATVRAGQTFQVTITTFGGGCERAGGTRVSVQGSVATISVYDFTVAGPAVSCTAMLKRLPRTVDLRFDAAGAATIRVEGLRVGSEATGAPKTLEQSVTVQ